MPEATNTSDLDLTEIDDISAPKEEAKEDTAQTNIPSHLQRHECGLWQILACDMSLDLDDDGGKPTHYKAKDELIRYLSDHGIDHGVRKGLQVTDTERRLFEIYTKVQRQHRVSKEHFVSALRLCHHGYELWPTKSKNLNEMKVT